MKDLDVVFVYMDKLIIIDANVVVDDLFGDAVGIVSIFLLMLLLLWSL
jgi:hypothetical protein